MFTKRICLLFCYIVCVVLLNKNIDIFMLDGLLDDAYSIGLFAASITITFALTVAYIALDKMIREAENK